MAGARIDSQRRGRSRGRADFYSANGQTVDGVTERLASKYARKFDVTVATSDLLERETVTASGADTISAELLRTLVAEGRQQRSHR